MTTTGLPRARQIIAKIETQLSSPSSIQAAASQAQAIATIALAESTELRALIELRKYEASRYSAEPILSPAERDQVIERIRALAGFAPERKDRV